MAASTHVSRATPDLPEAWYYAILFWWFFAALSTATHLEIILLLPLRAQILQLDA